MNTATEADASAISIIVVSKDEPALATTLDRLDEAIAASRFTGTAEVIVVDASSGRLDSVRRDHASVRWFDFAQPRATRITIAHQRNVGVRAARGRVVVFIDCGCIPAADWLDHLLAPICSDEERMVCGQTGATGPVDPHARGRKIRAGQLYLPECPTINLAFERAVFDEVGPFDESFEYGSDIDFSWRAVHLGIRIRYAEDAVVLHDWGSTRRQLRRAFGSGKGRARLFAKHVLGRGPESTKKRRLEEHDLVPLAYSLYLLGLPIAVSAKRAPAYLALVLLPLWRSRDDGPIATLVDHFAIAIGVLAGAAELARGAMVCTTRHPNLNPPTSTPEPLA